jgi:hypothetical protein
MKQDYVIYPSMLGMESGAIWYYTTSRQIDFFDKSNPLNIYADACSLLTVCIWYISPIWQFDGQAESAVAFMGDFGKWVPVSRQRFTSIVIDPKENQARVTYQGVFNERISIITFNPYSEEQSCVSCFVNRNGTGWAVITSTIITCTQID